MFTKNETQRKFFNYKGYPVEVLLINKAQSRILYNRKSEIYYRLSNK